MIDDATLDAITPPGVSDDRTRALIALAQRLLDVDRTGLLLYRFDSTPSAALPALAWQLSMLGLAGWDFAATDDQKRELLRRAIEFHRHRGTPWAITEALKAVGWPNATIREPFGAPQYDGTYKYDGTISYWDGGAWPKFGVTLGPIPDDYALTLDATALFRGVVEAWKNARSHLIELSFDMPDPDEVLTAPADDPMAVDLTTYHRYDGDYLYDGTIDFSGSDTVTLAAS